MDMAGIVTTPPKKRTVDDGVAGLLGLDIGGNTGGGGASTTALAGGAGIGVGGVGRVQPQHVGVVLKVLVVLF